MKKESALKKNSKEIIFSMFMRYFLILISSLGNLTLFYFIFTPLTTYTSYFILNLIYGATLSGPLIALKTLPYSVLIIDACVAGSAYFLLVILNLSIPTKSFLKTLKMLGFAFGVFFIINIIRIVSLTLIYINVPRIFKLLHQLTWYIGSVVLIIGIWYLEIKLFKIKDIPAYTDIKTILSYIKRPKKTKKQLNKKRKNKNKQNSKTNKTTNKAKNKNKKNKKTKQKTNN